MLILGAILFVTTPWSVSASASGLGASLGVNPALEGGLDPAGSALISWIRNHGGVIDRMDVRQPGSGPRGVFANAAIAKGGPMFIIPDRVLIHRESVLNMSLNPAFNERLGEALKGLKDDFFLIAIYLAHEEFYNKENSAIRPYLDVLPRRVDVPVLWSQDVLQVFNTMPSAGKDYERYLLYKNAFITFVQENVVSVLPQTQHVDHDELLQRFLWAFTMVKSRAWGKLNGATSGCTLVPFADLLNHRSDGASLAAVFRDAASVDDQGTDNAQRERIGTGIEALMELSPGDEVFDSYSPLDSDVPQHCNSDMLLLYGFLEPSTRFDCFRIRISLNLTDAKLAEEKEQVMQAYNVSCSTTVVLRGSAMSTATVDHTLLLCFRIMFLENEEEVQRALDGASGNRDAESYVPAWSLANEYQALKHLIGTLRRTKESYPFSAEEDSRRLHALQSSHELALVDLRRREQQTLDVYIGRLRGQWDNLLSQDVGV